MVLFRAKSHYTLHAGAVVPTAVEEAEVAGLEREIREHITMDKVQRIAKAGADGRLLAVNTTDLDEGTSRVFDLVAEGKRAGEAGQLDRLHSIMLASAGIPGAFPFRIIDGEGTCRPRRAISLLRIVQRSVYEKVR